MKNNGWLILLSLLVLGLLACSAPQHQQGGFAYEKSKEPERITVDESLSKMQRQEPVTFIDSRSDTAWMEARKKIPGAIRVGNNEQLKRVARTLPKDGFIITYCT